MSNIEYLSDGPLMVVTTDLALRHDMAAAALGLTTPPDVRQVQVDHQLELVSLLAEAYEHKVIDLSAVEVRTKLSNLVTCFRDTALRDGKLPFVVSMDPVFLDPQLADYTFQCTRVSLVSPEGSIINLEHNPRSRANRFIYPADDPTNGAGRALTEQAEIVEKLLNSHDGPIALAFVDDYINSGKSIVDYFECLVDAPHIETTVIAGLVAPESKLHTDQRFHVVPAIALESGTHLRHVDMSDLLPTLGGRVIGHTIEGVGNAALTVPLTVAEAGHKVPVAVDAICGNYPWQADIYVDELSPACLVALGAFCVSTARAFWETMEATAGQELSWRDLKALTGKLRVYSPAEDLTSSASLPATFQATPRRAIEAIIHKGVGA